jgi:hypothetical protein
MGGTNPGTACTATTTCTTNTACTGGGLCCRACSTTAGICGGTFGTRCTAGANAGAPCSIASHCPGGSCGGGPANSTATNYNQCDGTTTCSPTNTCVGGANQAANCGANSECPGGACAAGNEGVCAEGPFDQFCGPNATFKGCAVDGDCASFNACVGGSNPGVACVPGGPICGAGGNINAPCTLDSECPGGTCSFGCLGGGTCNSSVGGPAEMCSVQKTRDCYLDNGVVGGTVTASGVVDAPTNDEADPTIAAMFCIAPTSTSSVNSAAGLPGLGRLELPGHAKGLP